MNSIDTYSQNLHHTTLAVAVAATGNNSEIREGLPGVLHLDRTAASG